MNEEVRFSSLLCRKLFFGLQAAERPKDSDSLCFLATLALIRLVTLSYGTLCRFAIFACWLG